MTQLQSDAFKPSPAGEEYLEATYRLRAKGGPVRVSALADYLGVAAPSASGMIKRLAEAGLVVRAQDSAVALTDEGEKAAVRIVRRHRLFERFLTDALGLSWDKVHDEACRLEHAASEEVTENLDRFLGNPHTCPHGSPIPSAAGVLAPLDTTRLVDCEAGDRGVIVRVDDEEPDMLRYLASLGLLPDVDVRVKEVAPFRGPILVEVGNSQYAIGREVAARIAVRTERRPGRYRRRGDAKGYQQSAGVQEAN
jgi:DtxR family transcriptional regulator, Mn-dependent transcriptional regulator